MQGISARIEQRCITPGLWHIEGWYAKRISRNPVRWRISKTREPVEWDYQRVARSLDEARELIFEETGMA